MVKLRLNQTLVANHSLRSELIINAIVVKAKRRLMQMSQRYTYDYWLIFRLDKITIHFAMQHAILILVA